MSAFVAGGTLPAGAQSYLRRGADDALFDALIAGRLAYVLDARQVGKSSLLAATAGRLRSAGITPIRIDLQRIGLNVTLEQWYGTMLSVVMEELGHEDAALQQWKQAEDRGPLNRWFSVLEEVYLPRITAPMVIFIDEIDFVLGLPFSTDEFFAGLRDWMSRIGGKRLTFCLAGMASPQDLIAQGDVTPFNIGTRVVLTDFSREDLEPYAAHLPGPTLDRIHHWTGGHPYLTQRLSQSLLETPGDVDERVKALFEGATGRTEETHLADIARRLAETPDPERRVAQIDAYRLVLNGKATLEAVRPEVLERLQLMGLIRLEGGYAKLRCPIYKLAFPASWARDQLPAAELARQQRAARRAGLRVASLSAVVFLGFLGLFAWGYRASRERDAALRTAQRQAYQSGMALVSQSAERRDFRRSLTLADTLKDSPFRGWEARYWRGVFGQFQFLGNVGPVPPAGIARFHWFDGEVFYSLTESGLYREGKLMDPAMALSSQIQRDIRWGRFRNLAPEDVLRQLKRIARSEPGIPKQMGGPLGTFARIFEAPEKTVAIYGTQGLLWQATVAERPVHRVVFDPLGRYVTVGSGHNLFQCFDLKTGQERWRNRGEASLFMPSPDGKWAIGRTFGGFPGRILDATTGKVVRILGDEPATFHMGDWSGDSKRVALIGQDGLIQIWEPLTSKLIATLVGPALAPGTVYLSQSGQRLVVESDGDLYSSEVDSALSVTTTQLLPTEIQLLQWAPNHRYSVASSIGGDIGVVDAALQGLSRRVPVGPVQDTHRISFSGSGDQFIASSVETGAWLFDRTGKQLRHLTPQKDTMAHGFLNSNEVWLFAQRRGAWVQPLGGGPIRALPLPPGDAFLLSHHPQSDRWLVAMRTGAAFIREKGREWTQVRVADNTRPTSATWDPAGNRVTLTTTAYAFQMIEFGQKPVVADFPGHGARVWGAQFSPDGTRLLSHSWDGLALIHDIRTRRVIGRTIHGSWVPNVAWSPDGNRIVTASEDGRVRVCDGFDGFEYTSFLVRPGFPFGVGFTPDGNSVYATDSKGNLHRWTARGPAP